jgi:hypothetical protein
MKYKKTWHFFGVIAKKTKSPSTSEGLSVSAEGLEPSTNGLKGRCSAIELRAHFYTVPQQAVKRIAFYHGKILAST